MVFKNPQTSFTLQIPYPYCSIVAPTCRQPAFWTKLASSNPIHMSRHGKQKPLGWQCPNLKHSNQTI